ncbi:alpha-rhamnosidase [Sphingobacterium olei]|uniref:alpha-L-rhamnosidase n=2 Tax=Sphingobacterium olei TaxID=2571155 RepID=A0A4U0P497_9SPHI|nr:alpha-rhamnosidase [Sphingobacterium olei]
MKEMTKSIGLIFLLCLSLTTFAQTRVDALRCELLENPISMDVLQPHLSWKIATDERNVVQLAYHVLVASSPEKLAQDIGDLWDSEKITSANSIQVIYHGKPLKSRNECFWKVKVYTNKGESEWSNVAQWTMGLLHYKDWTGRWIGFDRYFPTDNVEEGRLSARYLRKEFKTEKKVHKAIAYIMGMGLYELYIDGQKVGDQVLAPSPTDYTQNIKYNVFDVTDRLTEGDHALGVVLGNGRFYAMRQAKPYKVKTFGFPKLQFQLMITYTDGSTETIKTDDSWKGTANGPITANNEYDGEDYDARKELSGWANVGFDEHEWLPSEYVQEPGGTYEAQLNGHMKVMQDIVPVTVTPKGNGRFILDFGQNFSGWVKMKVKGESGTRVTLRFAESLENNGELFVTNLRDAKSTDHYTLRGGEVEEWEPRFTYHGFRYVEVSGYPGTPTKTDFVGRFVYDAMETVGTFTSSNILLNQIHQNAWWGIASNYKGMPVDCPQRNERQPWLGDRPVTAYGETFLFDNTNFYIKWLEDIRLSQKEDGAIPDVAPAFWRYYSDNITWPGTYLMIADMLYRQTGDIRVLEQHYPAMKKWINYMATRYMDTEGIITKDSYGDWCFPPVSIEAGRGQIADKKYPSALISSANYYYLLNLMSRFSLIVGQDDDKLSFEKSADGMKKAFNKRFYHTEGFYGDNKLTENILALYFGLVEEGNKTQLEKQIVRNIEVENNGHLSTGVVGIQWLMRTLTEMGRADLAYKLATNTTYPSWGYMVENGATTIWELWNGNTAHPKMNSQNHVMMLGDLLVWYYEHLAGIKSTENAFQSIIMKPEIVGDLTFVNASYNSSRGMIESHWVKSKSSFEWQVRIPVNAKAILHIPAKDLQSITEGGQKIQDNSIFNILESQNGSVTVEIGSGHYQFKTKL